MRIKIYIVEITGKDLYDHFVGVNNPSDFEKRIRGTLGISDDFKIVNKVNIPAEDAQLYYFEDIK